MIPAQMDILDPETITAPADQFPCIVWFTVMFQCVFSSGCSDLIYHVSAVWQQTRLAHLVPAPGWTTGWCSASCSWRWFGSEPSCGPGTHPSTRPRSARPAANTGQEMNSPTLLNQKLLELELEAGWTHQQNLPEPKNMIVNNSGALVGFVEEQSNSAHNQQHTQVLGQRVSLLQQRHAEDHHWNVTTDACEPAQPSHGSEFLSVEAETAPGRDHRSSSEPCQMITVWLFS